MQNLKVKKGYIMVSRRIRRIREAIEIKLRKPSLNRDNGFELASIYDTILAPWRPLYNPSSVDPNEIFHLSSLFSL